MLKIILILSDLRSLSTERLAASIVEQVLGPALTITSSVQDSLSEVNVRNLSSVHHSQLSGSVPTHTQLSSNPVPEFLPELLPDLHEVPISEEEAVGIPPANQPQSAEINIEELLPYMGEAYPLDSEPTRREIDRSLAGEQSHPAGARLQEMQAIVDSPQSPEETETVHDSQLDYADVIHSPSTCRFCAPIPMGPSMSPRSSRPCIREVLPGTACALSSPGRSPIHAHSESIENSLQEQPSMSPRPRSPRTTRELLPGIAGSLSSPERLSACAHAESNEHSLREQSNLNTTAEQMRDIDFFTGIDFRFPSPTPEESNEATVREPSPERSEELRQADLRFHECFENLMDQLTDRLFSAAQRSEETISSRDSQFAMERLRETLLTRPGTEIEAAARRIRILELLAELSPDSSFENAGFWTLLNSPDLLFEILPGFTHLPAIMERRARERAQALSNVGPQQDSASSLSPGEQTSTCLQSTEAIQNQQSDVATVSQVPSARCSSIIASGAGEGISMNKERSKHLGCQF